MIKIEANHFAALYRRTLESIMELGDKVSPRGMETRELRGAQLVLRDPRANILWSPLRKLNYHFSVAEFIWILLGRNDVATISAFNKQLAQFSDDGQRFNGAYGPKFVEQLSYVVNTLKADPDSRQAVINIWRERPGATKDVPCTLSWQFFIRGGRLELITTMRSNDAWLGLPYDLFTFTMIQNYVAMLLGVGLGPYRHNTGSLHLYQQHFVSASNVIEEPWTDYLDTVAKLRVPVFTAPVSASIEAEFLLAGRGIVREVDVSNEWDTLLAVCDHRFNKTTPLRPPWSLVIT